MTILLLLLLIVLGMLLTAMSVAFSGLSTSHLRYWAKQKDPSASKLYPLKAKGEAVHLTIELLRAFSVAGAFVLLAYMLGSWLAWLISSVVLFAGFIVLTKLYLKTLGLRLLAFTSPLLLSVTNLLRPITIPLGSLFDRVIEQEPVTLTKSELSHIVEGIDPSDTDLSKDEIRIIKHTLTFSDKEVHDVMTPRSVMTTVKEDEILSPVVIDELYQSGHSRFPVMSKDGKTAIGILYLHDLVDLTAEGKVEKHMKRKVYFVHEDRELDHVLQAFLKTKHQLFLVVNNFSEVVGLVTIEDIVEQILGKPIVDEFDKYDDMREVAENQAKKHHTQNKKKMLE